MLKVSCKESLLVVLRFENKIFLWRFPFVFAPHQAEHALLAFAANLATSAPWNSKRHKSGGGST